MKKTFKRIAFYSNAADIEPKTEGNLPIALKVTGDGIIDILDFCREDGSFTGYVPADYDPRFHTPSRDGYLKLEFGSRVRYKRHENLRGRNPCGSIFQQVEFLLPLGIQVEFLFNQDDIGKAHYEMTDALI